MALMKSDQCPCWENYPKGSSECIDMNWVLLWVLLAVLLFTRSSDDGSLTGIWKEQQQKLFSFHRDRRIPLVVRGGEDEANQLRVPSRGGWPKWIMTAPSPDRRSTWERDVCSRKVWTLLLKYRLFTFWVFRLHFGCVVKEAPQMPWKEAGPEGGQTGSSAVSPIPWLS